MIAPYGFPLVAQVISEEQRALNKALHARDSRFGNRSDGSGVAGRLSVALLRMHELGACNSVLDYGTGKGKLVKRLRQELPSKIDVNGYDPAVEEWEDKPCSSSDIVTCLDVLEHIELESIDVVLRNIKALTNNFCYLVVDLQPAVKTLEDGRNAHILLAPPEWWIGRVAQLFACQTSFPILHQRGLAQKLVIAATDQRNLLPLMYGFLVKLKIFDFTMTGGPLGSTKNN